jgi:hypothetical protein
MGFDRRSELFALRKGKKQRVWTYRRKRPDGEERTHVATVSELRYVVGVKLMLFWFPVVMLGIDALHVVEMRLRMIASGKSTPDEMFLMVTEKIGAMEEARTIVVRGGDPSLVIENYRRIVAANITRLSGK